MLAHHRYGDTIRVMRPKPIDVILDFWVYPGGVLIIVRTPILDGPAPIIDVPITTPFELWNPWPDPGTWVISTFPPDEVTPNSVTILIDTPIAPGLPFRFPGPAIHLADGYVLPPHVTGTLQTTLPQTVIAVPTFVSTIPDDLSTNILFTFNTTIDTINRVPENLEINFGTGYISPSNYVPSGPSGIVVTYPIMVDPGNITWRIRYDPQPISFVPPAYETPGQSGTIPIPPNGPCSHPGSGVADTTAIDGSTFHVPWPDLSSLGADAAGFTPGGPVSLTQTPGYPYWHFSIISSLNPYITLSWKLFPKGYAGVPAGPSISLDCLWELLIDTTGSGHDSILFDGYLRTPTGSFPKSTGLSSTTSLAVS